MSDPNKETSPPDYTPSAERPIHLTPAAIAAVKTAQREQSDQGRALRVSIAGGGCAGYQYGLDFEHVPRATDCVMPLDGLEVYIDPISAAYLHGTVIDHINGPEGAGFKFDNPNPRRRLCGCGSSWS